MNGAACQHLGERVDVERVTHPHGFVTTCGDCGETLAANTVTVAVLVHLNIDVEVLDPSNPAEAIAAAERYIAAHGIATEDVADIDPIG